MPDAKHIYTQSLQNTHAAEQQGLRQIELQLKGLDDYPDYAALLRAHAATAQRQLGQIEAALGDVGAGTGTLREAVTQAVGAAGAAVHALTPDTTLKNLYAGMASQGEQVAAYTSLKVIAAAAGYPGHASWIDAAIADEKEAAAKVEAIIPSVTTTFLAKEGA